MVLKNFSIFQIAESLNRRFRAIENLYDQKILEYLRNINVDYFRMAKNSKLLKLSRYPSKQTNFKKKKKKEDA